MSNQPKPEPTYPSREEVLLDAATDASLSFTLPASLRHRLNRALRLYNEEPVPEQLDECFEQDLPDMAYDPDPMDVLMERR